MIRNGAIYETLYLIANEPIELSHEKVHSQIRWWKKLAKDALKDFEENDESTENEGVPFDDDF